MKSERQVVLRRVIVGKQTHCLAIIGGRTIPSLRLCLGMRKVEPVRPPIGDQLRGLRVACDRFVELSRAFEHEPESVQGFRVVSLFFQGGFVRRARRLEVSAGQRGASGASHVGNGGDFGCGRSGGRRRFR